MKLRANSGRIVVVPSGSVRPGWGPCALVLGQARLSCFGSVSADFVAEHAKYFGDLPFGDSSVSSGIFPNPPKCFQILPHASTCFQMLRFNTSKYFAAILPCTLLQCLQILRSPLFVLPFDLVKCYFATTPRGRGGEQARGLSLGLRLWAKCSTRVCHSARKSAIENDLLRKNDFFF